MIATWTLFITVSYYGFSNGAHTQQMIFLDKDTCVESGSRIQSMYTDKFQVITRCFQSFRIDVK